MLLSGARVLDVQSVRAQAELADQHSVGCRVHNRPSVLAPRPSFGVEFLVSTITPLSSRTR